MSTTTLVGTPDPDDPGSMHARVYDFPAGTLGGSTPGLTSDDRQADSDAESGTGRDALVGPVLDAEIVDDDPAQHDTEYDDAVRVLVDPPIVRGGASLLDRARAGARRMPIVAPWLRSAGDVTAVARWVGLNVAHTVGFHAARLPLYGGKLALRSPRGVVRVIVATSAWTMDAEGIPLRQETIRRGDSREYLRLLEVRASRVRLRLGLLFVAVVALGLAGLVAAAALPQWAEWTVLAGLVLLCGTAGGSPDKPLAGPAVIASKTQRLTSEIVIRALGALGIAEINKAVGRGGGVTFPAPITRDGPGWRADVDLPYGVTVTDIMERRDRLASGLRRPLGCVWPEPAHDQHAGRLVLWVGDEDMSQARTKPWPLAKAGTVDVFKPVPFGHDQRGRLVTVLLMFANVLIGAMPGAGKTFALRVLMLAAALDPSVQLRVFELKGSGDLSAFEPVAHHYASGPDDATIEATMTSLREVYTDLERRAKTISGLPREVCPENKVTPELAVRRTLGLFPLVVAVDECQELFSHPELGKEAGELCTAIIKRGRALGVILLLATQRPDAKSLPTGVSANVGTRFCLRVMGQLENDMVLGTSAYKNGIRATTFTARDKGIGYLVGAADDPQIARSAYLDGPAAERVVARARALREKAGTLSGHAIGDTTTTDTTPARRSSVLADVAAVFAPGEDRLWSEVILARLADHDPTTYASWTKTGLAAALKPYGITPGQVWAVDPATQQEGNRRGYTLTTLADAHTRLSTQSDQSVS